MNNYRNPKYQEYLTKFYQQNKFDSHKEQADAELDHMTTSFGELYAHFEEIGEAIQKESEIQGEHVHLSPEFLSKWSYKGSPLIIKTSEKDNITYQYFLDDKGRDFGQLISHDQQVIAITEYDKFDRKICYEQNFAQNTIQYYHKLNDGDLCDESQFRALIVDGDLVRYGRWSSLHQELQSRMLQKPQEYNKNNAEEKYQKMLQNYDLYNTVFINKEDATNQVNPEQKVQKTIQGFITTEGDSQFALVNQEGVYTFAQLKNFETNPTRLNSYDPSVPYLLELYPAQGENELSSTVNNYINIVTPIYQSNMLSKQVVNTKNKGENAEKNVENVESSISYEGEFSHFLWPSPVPITKKGIFNAQQKLLSGTVTNPFYEYEGKFTEKGIFHLVVGKRTWFTAQQRFHQINSHTINLAQVVEKAQKSYESASENSNQDSKIELELSTKEYNVQLEQNKQFATFWNINPDIQNSQRVQNSNDPNASILNGTYEDPYSGVRLWEEGTFVNGLLEGPGKFATLGTNDEINVIEGMFLKGELVSTHGDNDGNGGVKDEWKFKEKYERLKEEQNNQIDKVDRECLDSLDKIRNYGHNLGIYGNRFGIGTLLGRKMVSVGTDVIVKGLLKKFKVNLKC